MPYLYPMQATHHSKDKTFHYHNRDRENAFRGICFVNYEVWEPDGYSVHIFQDGVYFASIMRDKGVIKKYGAFETDPEFDEQWWVMWLKARQVKFRNKLYDQYIEGQFERDHPDRVELLQAQIDGDRLRYYAVLNQM